jgi:hypothetical protein
MNQPARLIANTETCFFDFVEAYPQLPALRMIADFCDCTLQTVQAWQAGERLPGGLPLVKLRTLLYIAGYEVTELTQLRGDIRRLALLIGTSVLTVDEVKKKLEHKSEGHNSIWRIVLQGGGIPSDKQEPMRRYVARRKEALDEAIEAQRVKLEEATRDKKRQLETANATVSTLDPAVPVAFAHAVGMTISLGSVILHADGRQAALDATRNGQDLAELVEVLQAFLTFGTEGE